MAKVLTAASNECYKASIDATKSYRKDPEADADEFINTFINSRKGYYELQTYKEIVMQSPDVA